MTSFQSGPQHGQAAGADGYIGRPLSLSAGERLLRMVETVEQLKTQKSYVEADDLAWAVLRELGITDYQVLKQSTPQELLEVVPAPLHPIASRMLCELGLSYKFRREKYHLHAMRFLEDAVLFDPSNVRALVNLTDLCVEISPERIHPYIGRKETGYPTDNPEREMLREWELAFTLLQPALEREFGITEQHRNGELPAPSFGDKREAGYAMWALSNLGRVMLHIGRFDLREHPSNAGEPFFTEAAECAELALNIVGLPRGRRQLADALVARSSISTLGERSRAVAEAFSLLGTVSELRANLPDANFYYRVALEIEPGLQYARNRLKELSLSDAEAPRKVKVESRSDKQREAPRAKPAAAAERKASWMEFRAGQPELDGRLALALERALTKFSDSDELRPVVEQFVRDARTLQTRGSDAELALIDDVRTSEQQWWEKAYTRPGLLELIGVNLLLEKIAEGRPALATRAQTALDQCREIEEAAASDPEAQDFRRAAASALTNLLSFARG